MCTIERVKNFFLTIQDELILKKYRSAVRNRMRYPLANSYASYIASYEGMRRNYNYSLKSR